MTSLLKTKTQNHLLTLLGISLVCYLPFIGKAFHIDDPLFVWVARQIHVSPFDFFGFSVNWSGTPSPISHITQNPPLASYYIALAALIFGWSETALHLAFFFPFLLFIFGTYFVARNFCKLPFEASLISLAAPVVLISSSNVMCDIWLLAFWTWAVYFWMQGTTSHEKRYFYISSILIGLSFLSKFFGLNLIFLLAAYTFANKKRFSKELIFLIIPILIIIGYEWITHSLYGSGQLFSAMGYSQSARKAVSEPFWLKTLVGFCFTGGCYVSILFLSPLLCQLRILIRWIGLILILILILPKTTLALWPPFPSEDNLYWSTFIQCSFIAVGGLGLITLTILDITNRFTPNSILLTLWILGTFIFAANINWAINGRSFLPMAPAVGILIARRIEMLHLDKCSIFNNLKLVTAILISFTLAVWLNAADYRMANNARDAAKQFTQSYSQKSDSLFFSGHWGFQFYMEEGGGKSFDGKGLRSEDIIVIPIYNSHDFNLYFPPEKTLWKKQVEFPTLFGISSMNNVMGAGFYTYSWGPLPFAFGNVPMDKYLIYKLGFKEN
jgi:4-amino-4-deoxy-L-arabinose transferase-like glycosyltransferase